jgi:MHS family proline/betaine transporter-like MFS transporter
MISIAGMIAGAYPLYTIVNLGINAMALGVMVIFMMFVALGGATYQVWLAEVFPRSLRATGLGISYNVAAGVLGGTTPLLCVTLIEMTKNRMAPAGLLVVASVVSAIFLLLQRETGNRPLK